MCGICDIFDFKGREIEEATIDAMCRSMVHRGPDDQGVHVGGPVGLGMRRLSEPGDREAIKERLMRLIVEPELRKRMSAANLSRAQTHYDLDVAVRKLTDIFKSLRS